MITNITDLTKSPNDFVDRISDIVGEEETTESIMEYVKFMILASTYDNMTPSITIDNIWHVHLLYTKDYANFCKLLPSGEFIHHNPTTSPENDKYDNTLELYSKLFKSQPPSIWK